jgi:putative nucleotidyltransferase with HDIG domain
VIARGAHLAGRFATSLRPGGPNAADTAWAVAYLSPAEATLWHRMPAADRRESVQAGRRLVAALAGTEYAGNDTWTVAALLHDVGKTEARLGTVGRALATMAGAVAGHDMARAWQSKGGTRRRFGLYLRHDDVGAGMLEMAGSRREVIAWARAHHHPEMWATTGIPEPVARALAIADGEQIANS